MLRQRRGLIIGCLNYSSSYIEDFQANNNNKSVDSHASLLRQLMGLKTKFKVQLMQGTVKELRPSFMESFMFLWLHWVDAGGGGAYLRSWEEPPSLKPNVTEMSRLRWKTNHLGGEGGGKLCQTEIIRLETTGPHKSK